MVERFEEWVEQHSQQVNELTQHQDEEYARFQRTLNDLLDKLRAVVEGEAGAGRGERYSAGSAVQGDPPVPIDLIKRLLGKLKALIPERWWSGPLRGILDRILEDLSPQNPEEFKRLLSYIDTVYVPALEALQRHWRQEMELEARELSARTLLTKLLQQEIGEL